MIFNTFFLQAITSFSSAQAFDIDEQSYAPSMMDKAASVGLAQPTSPAIYPKETSPEVMTLKPTATHRNCSQTVHSQVQTEVATGHAGGILNVLGGAAEGDIHGANPRQNMVYLGFGRHGFGVGAECDGCLGCGGSGHGCCGDSNTNRQSNNCDQNRQSNNCNQNHQAAPCEPNRNAAQPYLKVTPTMKVESITRTHVETKTSAIYDVSTSLRTRTITDEVKSTRTDFVHPEQTYTYVEYQTVYEYPATTIDAANIIHPRETGVNHNKQSQGKHCC